ncbi:hypothetical protein LZ023_38375 (plasmid) [Pseudomonas silvicola]|nr:hypothetical protein LZ023_38375 [Pseudomonas silvicola]
MAAISNAILSVQPGASGVCQSSIPIRIASLRASASVLVSPEFVDGDDEEAIRAALPGASLLYRKVR